MANPANMLGRRANGLPVAVLCADDGRLEVNTAGAATGGAAGVTFLSYQHVALVLAADTLNQQIVAAPGAGRQIWVYGLTVLADTGAGTIAFQDSADVALTGAMALSDEGGFSVAPSGNFLMPIWKVPTNRALEADTVTLSAAGWLDYAIVVV